jgi:acyl-CoA reductase-like NAD-dependent aldehyde dehydrogenase
MNVARRIRTGSMNVNGGMCIAGDLLLGGIKGSSGIGRDKAALNEQENKHCSKVERRR